jgi:hypothetical protein
VENKVGLADALEPLLSGALRSQKYAGESSGIDAGKHGNDRPVLVRYLKSRLLFHLI